MTYADKASMVGGAKDIRYLSPPITQLIFFLVYNHKMIKFLQLKHESKKIRRQKQKELMAEDPSSHAELDPSLQFHRLESTESLHLDSHNKFVSSKSINAGGTQNRIGNHHLFNLDQIMKYEGLLESLKSKPLYKLYTLFKENLESDRYRKFLKIKTQKTIDDELNKKRKKESATMKKFFMKPKDKRLLKLEKMEKEEESKLKQQLSSVKFKSKVYQYMEMEGQDEYKEFKLAVDRKYMLVLVLTALDYFTANPKEFETFNNYEDESFLKL